MNIQAIDTILSSTDVVNILGSYLDSELTLERQVYILQQTLQVCYFHLRRLSAYITKFSGISAAIRDELHWLPIRKRIEFKIILFKRHCLVGSASESSMELSRPVSSAVGRQSLRAAFRGELVALRFLLQTFVYQAYAVSGPQLSNSLPSDVRQSRDNLILFKKKLKTFLFQQF